MYTCKSSFVRWRDDDELTVGDSVWDLAVIFATWKATKAAEVFIDPAYIQLPHPLAYPALRFSLWALYTFITGLFATGIWVLGHECGHQAFSESKTINNTVGWVLHSA